MEKGRGNLKKKRFRWKRENEKGKEYSQGT
jgi:hypothetical protein